MFAGCIDACILATLAFILATRHVRLQPEPMYQNSMFKGNLNAQHIHIERVHFHSTAQICLNIHMLFVYIIVFSHICVCLSVISSTFRRSK